MNVNALQQWLDFYDKQMPTPGGGGMGSMGGAFYSPSAAAGARGRQAYNNAGSRMNFALQMAEKDAQQAPDFFGDDGGMAGGGMGAGGGMPQAKFVRPERFNDPMPERQSFASPMRGDIENFLAKYLRGR